MHFRTLLTAKYRELISGYALPGSIFIISILAAFVLTKVSSKYSHF